MTSPSEMKLLPCPFCGGEAFVGTTLDDSHYAMCRADDCWAMTGYLGSEAEAVTAWNRRPLPPQIEGPEVVGRLLTAYGKVAEWPEKRMPGVDITTLGSGFSDLLSLRNLVPEAVSAINTLSAIVEWLEKAREDYTAAAAEAVKANIALTERLERAEAGLNEAFDFLGGVDGAVEVRETILAALLSAKLSRESGEVKLTKEMVLLAVKKAVSPDSAYVNDEVQKMHRDHVYAGGKGFPPRTSLVLARLNALAADGMLEKSRFTNGYYGYRWTITPAGRAALQDSSVEGKQGGGDEW